MRNTTRDGAIIDVNLLPRQLRPAEVSWKVAIGVVALAIAIVGLIVVGARAGQAGDNASAMEQRAEGAEAEVRALQVDLNRVRTLRVQIDEASTERSAIEAQLAALRGGSRPLGDDLALLWAPLAAHPGIEIRRIAPATSGVTVTGAAPGPLEAIAYAQALTSEGGFRATRMVSFAPAGTGGGEFVIEATR